MPWSQNPDEFFGKDLRVYSSPAPPHFRALCVEQLPELRGMFERILCIARSFDGPAVGNIELADRLIDAVVSWSESSLAQPEPVADNTRQAVYAAVAEALGDSAYDCLRVWEAWGYGTMGPDDFYPVADDEDRVAEIADAAIEATLRTTPKPDIIPKPQFPPPRIIREDFLQ